MFIIAFSIALILLVAFLVAFSIAQGIGEHQDNVEARQRHQRSVF
jgi:hypothetical protein